MNNNDGGFYNSSTFPAAERAVLVNNVPVEEEYTNVIGEFYIPIFTPLVPRDEDTLPRPKVKDYSIGEDSVQLIIPGYIANMWLSDGVIPAKTEFIVVFIGGILDLDNCRIIAPFITEDEMI